MTAPDLKPCPFCGGKASMKGGPVAQESFSVWCVNRHSMEGGFDAAALATAWNTRTTPLVEALAVPEVAALVEAVGRFEKLMQTQMRTADYHGDGCGCIRCAEDAMFAALRAIGEGHNG